MNALLEHRTNRLEEALARLADAQIETQFQIQFFKEEDRGKLNREFGILSNKIV